MTKMVSDFIIERLGEWGIKRIFGYTGDGINGVMGALDRHSDTMEFVQVRHEEMASLMATAHAKFTGEVGVCVATSGPGAIHLLNGLYDAKLDHQPVVALVGQQALMSMGGNYQQEVDLLSLFKDVASDFVQVAASPTQVRHLIDRAVRIAKGKRTVTALILPRDLQEQEVVEEPPRKHGAVLSAVGYTEPIVVPSLADLEQAAKVLNQGQKVAILVGAGALHASREVIEVAELLGAGVAKALLGKAALPDDLPFVTGSVGYLGTKATSDMMNQCDTFFMIGSSMPYAEYLPKEGQARGVQIDQDSSRLSIRYPMEANLVGDSAETLQKLIPLLQRKTDRSWRQQIEHSVTSTWEELEKSATHPANPLNPQRVFWELSSRLPDRSILTADSGSSSAWLARHIKIRSGMKFSVSGGLATMGCGVPYAIAAKFAYPDRPVFALVGDGAMQMNGLNELITIAKYWKKWSDPHLIVLVINNRDLNFVTWEQRTQVGEKEFTNAQQIPDFPYARYAELLGFKGIKVEKPEEVAAAWDEALKATCPVVLEAYTDADVPVLPPEVMPELVEKFSKAMSEPDPDKAGVLAQTAQENPDLAQQVTAKSGWKS